MLRLIMRLGRWGRSWTTTLWSMERYILISVLTMNLWKNKLYNIHKRRQLFFRIFDKPLPHVGSFLLLYVGNFDQFLTPPPLPIADVVYGRPLSPKNASKIQNYIIAPVTKGWILEWNHMLDPTNVYLWTCKDMSKPGTDWKWILQRWNQQCRLWIWWWRLFTLNITNIWMCT